MVGSFFDHGEPWPDTLRVLLLIEGALLPSGFRGRRTSMTVTHLDQGRTLRDSAGLTPVAFPGRNLLASVDADAALSFSRFAFDAHGLAASITRKGWYLLLHLRTYAGTLLGEKHEALLSGLHAGPGCLTTWDLGVPGDPQFSLDCWWTGWPTQSGPACWSVAGP